ncbi:MAG: hypothetical protein PUJ57_05125 [Peptoniphilaceae bacterium]|nr:hypothetical protein [Peptoniphilaceae bacterium]MDY6085525.1 hypothetical protein [Peptoniphilaceae bacterium]
MALGNYDDFNRLECDTRIAEEKDGYYAFEDTVFWGEKGGMPSDKGTINGLPVTDLKWVDGTLWHQVDGALSNPIHMQVDAEERWQNTAIQSALHLFDGYFRRQNHTIVAIGVHPHSQWMEVDVDSFTDDELDEMQDYIDEAIRADIPLEISYAPGIEYPDPNYRQYDQVRIVKYGDLDVQPCGTPHLHSTGEIGSFVILNAEKTNRGTRVYLTVGTVTRDRLKKTHRLVRSLMAKLNTLEEDLEARVDALLEQEQQQKAEISALQKEKAGFVAVRLAQDDASYAVVDDEDVSGLRAIGQEIAFTLGKKKVLLSEKDGKTSIVIAAGDDSARDTLALWKDKADMRGGGSPKLVNGQLPYTVDEALERMGLR